MSEIKGTNNKWVDDIVTALSNLGGEASLQEIYLEVEPMRINLPKHWQANIQKTIYEHCSDSGFWDFLGGKPANLFYKAEDVKPVTYGLRGFVIKPEPLAAFHAEDVIKPPRRVKATIERIVRDTPMVRKLKSLHKDKCQCCGTSLMLNKRTFSEGHHLRPLGGDHKGLDVKSNIVILCPNCHVLFDYRAVSTKAIKYFVDGHSLSQEYIEYHDNLYRQRK